MRIAAMCCWLTACGFSANGATSSTATDAAVHDGWTSADAAHPPTPPDAAFAAAACPQPYTTIGGTGTSSAYRVPPDFTSVTWQDAEAACEADGVGGGPHTHLVVFETSTERDAVMAAAGPALDYFAIWTGVYTAGSNDPWLQITGGDMADTAWSFGQPFYDGATDPFDGPNGAELAFTGIGTTGYESAPLDDNEAYVCECDDRAVVHTP